MGNARFARDGSIIYSAAWDGGDSELYLVRTDDPGSRPIGLKHAEVLSISKNGELAIRLNTVQLGGYARTGTVAARARCSTMFRTRTGRPMEKIWQWSASCPRLTTGNWNTPSGKS